MKKSLLTCLALSFLAACGSGGGSEAGNPGDSVLRPVIGSVSSGGSGALNRSLGKSALGESCGADTIQATDNNANVTEATLQEDCSFELELATGTSYIIGFISDENYVASLVVQNGANLPESSIFFLSTGNDPVDLGEVIIVGERAEPSLQPAEQCDRDEDGENDFEDDDDDNDGQSDDVDEDEEDDEEED